MRYCRAILILAVFTIAYVLAVLTAKVPFLMGLLGLVLVAKAARKGYQGLTAFGTARWSSAEDLEQAGMLSEKPGLIIGRIYAPRPGFVASLKALFDRKVPHFEACERFVLAMRKLQPQKNTALVKLSNAVHVAVFAPTGVGKGVSCVIPHLLNCPESMVVVDFKGENYLLTAKHRQEKFGHRIVVLDPFKVVTKTPDSFNPLDRIDAGSPLLINDCRSLANALVIRTGEEKDPHWADSAELWIGAMAITAALYGADDDRSLQTVRTLLTNPHKMAAVIDLLCKSTACGGMASRIGYQLTNYKDKELSSVLTTTNRFMNFLDTLAVAESTRTSSFNPDDLCKGKMTVYLVLPPDRMREQSALLRMWIGAMLRAVVQGGLQEKNKVHFVLDEAASLGRMDALDDAVDKYRGYGVRLQFYYQSMGQLRKCWGEGGDTTILSNTTQVYFGVNDQQTAEYVSNRLGEATIVVDSGGDSDGESDQSSSPDSTKSRTTSRNRNRNWARQARKLLKPEEVAGLPPRTAITFAPGVPPIMTSLVRYYEEGSRGEGRWKRIRWLGEVWLASLLLLLLAAGSGVLVTAMRVAPIR